MPAIPPGVPAEMKNPLSSFLSVNLPNLVGKNSLTTGKPTMFGGYSAHFLSHILFFIVTASGNCFAASIYTLGPTKDLVISFASLGMAILSLFISHSANRASKEDIPLPKSRVNIFDRGLMYEFKRPMDFVSDITLYELLAMSFVLLAGNIKNGNTWPAYGTIYTESIILVFGTCELLKNLILRYRPYCYFGDVPSGKNREYYKSFPSRHTAFAFMSAGLFTFTFFTEYPNSSWKFPLIIASYFLAAGVGFSRILSGNHFRSDVLTGAALGSVYGYLIPWLHL